MEKKYALSHAQRRLWVLNESEVNMTAYNMPTAIHIEGILNIAVLKEAFEALVKRHEILRTHFVVGETGTPMQVVKATTAFALPYSNWQGKESAVLEDYIRIHANHHFDLSKGGLLKIELLQTAKNSHILLFNMHHIISDGWSLEVLFREVSVFYNSIIKGVAAPLPALKIQYKDYAAWHNQMLSNEGKMSKFREYWQEQLADSATLELVTDFPRPLMKSHEGSAFEHVFSVEILQQLEALSQKAGVSLFMTLTALLKVLLYRYTHQTDIVVGTPTAGRNHPDLYGQIGFYINTVVLRNQLDGTDSFLEALAKIKQTTLAAFDRDVYPYDRLVEELDIERDQSRNPIFDVMVILQNNEQSELKLGDTTLQSVPRVLDISKFDLTFCFATDDRGLQLEIEYSTALFKKDRIERIVQHFGTLLESVLAKPTKAIHQLNILPQAERQLLLQDFNAAHHQEKGIFPLDHTIVDIFEAQVEQTPDNIAVIFDSEDGQHQQLTYRQLNEKANQAAHYLKEKYNIQADDVIALQLQRSEWMIVAIMGVLKSGAAYLPIGTDYPKARVDFLLQDTKAKVLLTDEATYAAAKLSASYLPVEQIEQLSSKRSTNPNISINNRDLAYIVYTSGSTGQPKGVLTEHISVVSFIQTPIEVYQANALDRVLQFSTYTFDTSVFEIFLGLFTGAALIIPKTTKVSAEDFAALIKRQQVTILDLPPKFMTALHRVDLGSARILAIGGDYPDVDTLKYYSERFRCFNGYGPTETAVCCSLFEVPEGWEASYLPIGKPFYNTDIHILDEHNNLCPIGISGEVCIGGSNLTRGYLNNPELTAEKFVPHPFKPGERIYRSGDLACWQADGNLKFLGRIDFQVKIRGYRIETAEIEHVLLAYSLIESAVVLAKEIGQNKELVAYLVGGTSKTLDIKTVREYLSEQLPNYMIPTYFIVLETLPLNRNGKLDRKALPEPTAENLTSTATYIAPRNTTEATLVTIWEEILQRASIGIDDNFFDLGGHSLRAIRLVALIQKELSVKIALSELFTHATIAKLGQLIGEKDIVQLQAITAIAKQDSYPLSHAQRGIWLVDQLQENLTVYNIPAAIQIDGHLDVSALEQAFELLINRHEILRTRFVIGEAGIPQQIIEPIASFTLPYNNGQQKNQRELDAYILAHGNFIFDLSKGDLLKIELLQTATDSHLLLFNMHHIISDGWSINILLQELSSFYNALIKGEEASLPALAVQYKDYTAWQNKLLANDEQISEVRQYWQQKLSKPPSLELPLDFPRPKIRAHKGEALTHTFSPQVLKQLEMLSRSSGASLFMSLTALVNILLYRYTNQEDLLVGTPTAGRNHPDLHKQIGLYINTVVLRNQLDGADSFTETLAKIRETTLAAFERNFYPFDKLVEELSLEKDQSRNPIFDVLLVLQNNEQDELILGETTINELEGDFDFNKFDLTFSFSTSDAGLELYLDYSIALFKKDRMERMLQHFGTLIESILVDSEQPINKLSILPQVEKQLLLQEFNNIEVGFPSEKTIIDLFEAQVQKTPNHIAVSFEDIQLTYDELNEKANQVAHYLREEYAIQSDDIVALQLTPNEWMIVAILGVLKSGAAYLPIAPDFPEARVTYMLEDSQAKVILTNSSTIVTCPIISVPVVAIEKIKNSNKTNLPKINQANDLAYIIYTSGSTGQPKGVMIEHLNVVRLLFNDQNKFDFDESDVWTLFHYFGFDFSVWEIWGALLYGGKLIVVPKPIALDPNLFSNLLYSEQVTVLNQVPSTFDQVQLALLQQAKPLKLRYVIFGGAQLLPETLQEFHATYPTARLINMYGITETTVHVTYKEITEKEIEQGTSNVGQALPTLACYVLDANHDLLPIGVAGEICVAGLGLARGYLNQPELTAQKFIPHPFGKGDKLYKSGDLGRVLPNGDIEHLGRIDQQLKIRGYRIEAGEIEARLCELATIQQATVIAKEQEGSKQLVAYYVPVTPETTLTINELRSHLLQDLPPYMIPAFFIPLLSIPLTRNGKVDSKQLEALDLEITSTELYVAPTTTTEEKIVEIWQKYLKVKQIGIHDNFFELGGDSIRAISLIYNINVALSINLSIRDIFEYTTVSSLAQHIDSKGGNEDGEKEYLLALEWIEKEQQNVLSNPTLATCLPTDLEDFYPMSDIQKGMVFHSLKSSTIGMYQDQFFYQIKEASFDYELFRQAYGCMIDRHEILRASLHLDQFEAPIQVIHQYDIKQVNIAFEDLSNQSKIEQKEYLESYLIAEQKAFFQLDQAGLCRIRIFQLADDEIGILWIFHHAILDGWSVASFITELIQFYLGLKQGIQPPKKSLAANQKDYMIDQWVSKNNQESKDYWQTQLAGSKKMALPYHKQLKDEVEDVGTTKEVSKIIPVELENQISALAASCQVSVKEIFFSAYCYLMQCLTQEEDIIVGLVSNSRPVIDDGDKMLGCFLNTIPFKIEIPSDISGKALIDLVWTEIKEVKKHDKLSLFEIAKLTGHLGKANPLFDIVFNYVNFHVQESIANEITFTEPVIDSFENTNTIIDFIVNKTMEGNDTQLILTYSDELYEAAEVENMLTYYINILKYIVSNPNLSITPEKILGEKELDQLLYEFNDTKANFLADKTIIDLFEEQVEKTPNNIAVAFKETQLTYQELNEKANRLGHYLRTTYQIQPNDIIALQLERSEWMLVAILGVLKAGAAYLPIAPDSPNARTIFMLEDAKAKVLIADEATYATVQEMKNLIPTTIGIEVVERLKNKTKTNLEHIITSKDLAYIIYTSGSTGQPKGVMIEHLNVNRLLFNDRNLFDFKDTDVWTLFHYFGFDFSVWEIWGALLYGGKLIVVPKPVALDPSLFAALLHKEQVTVLNQVPSTFDQVKVALLQQQQTLNLRYVIFGGAALKPASLQEFHTNYPQVRLINMYGITETTVHVTYKEITSSTIENSLSNVGKPIPTLSCFILDKNGNLLPTGVAGEICVAGSGLARGYLNNSALTAQKFIPHPFANDERLYKSGDLGRWLPNGDIEYLGRIDHQLKIRGYRIEAGEIEQILMSHPTIQSAVVIGYETAQTKELTAYLVAKGTSKVPDITTLRSFLSQSLPDYMIPTYFVELEYLPLTSSGKVNRKALPNPDMDSLSSGTAYEAPRNKVEQAVVTIWEELLNRTPIGIHDNFFAIGGHSLKAIQVISTINKALEVTIPLRLLFQYPTIAGLVETINEKEDYYQEKGIHYNSGAAATLFVFPPILGLAMFYERLAALCPEMGWYCFDFLKAENRLELYYQQIKQQQPEGPYILFGYSMGGNLAFEMARFLENKGETVSDIILGDSAMPLMKVPFHVEEHLPVLPEDAKSDWQQQQSQLLQSELFLKVVSSRMEAYHDFRNNLVKMDNVAIQANIHQLKSEEGDNERKYKSELSFDWDAETNGDFIVYPVEGTHEKLFDSAPYLETNMAILKMVLERIQSKHLIEEPTFSDNNS